MRMYWTRLEIWHGAIQWSWEDPDGHRLWVGYPAWVKQEPLIHECHEGADHTTNTIQRYWFCPGMMRQVQRWIAAWEGCQSRKPPRFSRCCPLLTLVMDGLWNRMAMDLMGLLPKTALGNKHVLVVADPLTKWVEAFPVPWRQRLGPRWWSGRFFAAFEPPVTSTLTMDVLSRVG